MIIRTPDHRLRVFVSSSLKELAEERKVVRQAILRLHLAPIMFESGARPHPAQELYKSYLTQSQVFIGIYWQSYGWVAPGMQISGLEDEYQLSEGMPRLIYIKNPASNREPALKGLLDLIRNDNTSCYTFYSTAGELEELVQNDLALLLTERFEAMEPNEQPPIETLPHPLTNLPIPRNALIDREGELATASNLLLRDDIALVTLTGAGGTGKSRLALQLGIEMSDHFKDGVHLVKLESITDPDLVISTIAETLGIRETTGSRPIGYMLKDFLREKQMLLLLDNFEQVVMAGPEVAELLEFCPGLKCVVTSRTPLRLRAEKELPVPPLSAPSPEKFTELYSLSQYASVELFIQRAQAVMPDFVVTNANAAAVAEICYRLDGLPLAIELAAARIKMLTPHELLIRLEQRFDILRSGTRDLPERQRTLRGAIDWSYNLLHAEEKKLFRRLSIFIGGWTLEAAETVCDLDDDLSKNLDDALASLIDNNLVIKIQENEERWRFGMLATIHEYAYERLIESDEADIIHNQHAQYYLGFVKMVEVRFRSAERVRWRQIIQQEFGNIRRVLEWVSTTGNCIEIGQQIITTLGVLWVTCGYIAEGQQWCTQIMSLADESTPIATRLGLLSVAGWIAWAQGNHFLAQASVDESLEIFRSAEKKTLDEKHAYATVMILGGILASASRDLTTAAAMYQKSIELLRETRDQWWEALALSFLGDIALYENDSARAVDLHDQSIKLARQQGDPWCLVPSLMSTAQAAVLDGDLTKARSCFLEAEDLLRKTGDHWSLSWALNDLGHIALIIGEIDQASVYFLEALTLANSLGNQGALLIILTGSAAIIAGHWKEHQDTQPQHLAKLVLAGRLCGTTGPHIHTPGVFVWSDSKMLYDTDISQVRSLLGDDLWEKSYSEGENIPFDQAITLAIQSLRENA